MDSILEQELEPLKAQIDQVQEKLNSLQTDMRLVEAELETFSADQQRFDALSDVCSALDKLGEIEAADLFWQSLPGEVDGAGHVEKLRERIAGFENEIREVQDKRDSLKQKTDQHLDELDLLEGQVYDAYAREERRKEEYLIERDISPIPYRRIIMPWSHDGESEKLFRKSLLIALLLCLIFGYVIPLISVPIPDRSAPIEIPERLAMLVKKEPPLPEPVPEPPKKEEKEEVDEAKPTKDQPSESQTAEQKPKPAEKASGEAKKAARKRAESVGVLAFKSSFADLMDEIPVASVGLEARVRKGSTMPAGQAHARRSLVAMQAQGGSGGISGIGNVGVSRNVGSGNGGGGGSGRGISGVGFARVESAVADLVEEEGRPVSDGVGPARTDEEIQIVFDRYKAALYRIYNKQLRKNPTLKGKILLRLTIETSGEVSMCKVESTDLDSKELVAKILARVQKFNFGPKEGVPKTTILYPIDFLPAG